MPHFVQLLLLLSLLILATKIGGIASARLGQPSVFGEILAGLVLGPTALNIFSWPVFNDHSLHLVVKDFAEIGVVLLMFLAGLETDADKIKRVGLAALSGAAGGVLFPLAGGSLVSHWFGYPLWEGIFIGVVLTATSVSISVQTLMELRRLHGKVGMTILGAAVIDDIFGVLALSLVVALGPSGGGVASGSGLFGVGLVLLKMVVFFAGAVIMGYALRAGTDFAKRLGGNQFLFTISLVAVLIYSWGAEAVGGLAAITGAYIAGIILGATQNKDFVEDKLKTFAYALFVPLFLASIGIEGDVRTVHGQVLLFAFVLTLVAIVTKAAGAALGTYLVRYSLRDSVSFGVGMISRGEVALIMANIGLASGTIDESIFSILVLMTLVTTIITPVLLRFSFREKREETAVH